jgi:hypothetical protein
MRPYQIFATMSPARAQEVFHAIHDKAPGALIQALGAACGALRVRPVFLQKLPFEKRVEAIRKTLARVAGNQLAEEMLAVYFLHVRKELLIEWLDLVGVKHEDGALESEQPAEPERAALIDSVAKFRAGDGPADRELLLQAFAAQSAVEWPTLLELLHAQAP